MLNSVKQRMMTDLFFQYIFWHFVDMPREILKGGRNILIFGLNYFSLPLLLKTFFSPWRRIQWVYEKGFNLGKFFEIFIGNLISRILGAIIRSGVIIGGIIAELFLLVMVIGILLLWILLPVLILFGFYYGFRLLS